MKALLALGLLVAMASAVRAADVRLERNYSPRVISGIEQFSYTWAPLPLLPLRFQNHCGFYEGHFTCADHCGIDYQVYFCSKVSSGCCRIGEGYCDDYGHLRCRPPLF